MINHKLVLAFLQLTIPKIHHPIPNKYTFEVDFDDVLFGVMSVDEDGQVGDVFARVGFACDEEVVFGVLGVVGEEV